LQWGVGVVVLEPFCKEVKGAEKRRDFRGDFGERFRGIETKEGFKIANFFSQKSWKWKTDRLSLHSQNERGFRKSEAEKGVE
jgi:hypothetical protein